MKYQLEQDYSSVTFAKDSLSSIQKLQVAQNVLNLGKYFEKNTEFVLVMSPLNIYIHEKSLTVKVLYVGIKGAMPVTEEFSGLPIDQVKNLLGFLFQLNEKIFSTLSTQEQVANIQFRQAVDEAKDFHELEEIIQKEHDLQKKLLEIRQQEVAKKKEEEEEEDEVEESIEEEEEANHNQPITIPTVTPSPKKYTKIIAISIATLLIGGISFYFAKSYLFPSSQANPQENHFEKGKNLVAAQLFDEAIQHFDKVDFKKLTKDQLQIVLSAYINANKPQRIIDLQPNLVDDVLDFYIKDSNFEAIKKLKSNHLLIQFEQAVIKDDRKTILSLINKLSPKQLDQRRIFLIAFTYMKEHDFNQALEFVKKHKEKKFEVVLSHIQKNDYTKAFEQAKLQKSKFLMQIVKEKEMEYISKSNISITEKRTKINAIKKEIESLKKEIIK
ncbi:hypothetical protein [Thermoflavimicrobium daqui]|nr:hypothetical protein [Thermoflavimicrobium daqui]